MTEGHEWCCRETIWHKQKLCSRVIRVTDHPRLHETPLGLALKVLWPTNSQANGDSWSSQQGMLSLRHVKFGTC